MVVARWETTERPDRQLLAALCRQSAKQRLIATATVSRTLDHAGETWLNNTGVCRNEQGAACSVLADDCWGSVANRDSSSAEA